MGLTFLPELAAVVKALEQADAQPGCTTPLQQGTMAALIPTQTAQPGSELGQVP